MNTYRRSITPPMATIKVECTTNKSAPKRNKKVEGSKFGAMIDN